MNIELMRLLENIVRIGVVTEINTDTWEVRVQTGGLTTNWIRWNSGRAGKFKIWIPPSPDEQVFLLCQRRKSVQQRQPATGIAGKRNGHYRAGRCGISL